MGWNYLSILKLQSIHCWPLHWAWDKTRNWTQAEAKWPTFHRQQFTKEKYEYQLNFQWNVFLMVLLIIRHQVIMASCQIHKIAGCPCSGNARNVFPATVGWRSRHASRHAHDARAVKHAGIANKRFYLKSVAGKTFPAFPAHAQLATYVVKGPCLAPSGRQTIVRIITGVTNWRIYASLGLNQLTSAILCVTLCFVYASY